MARDCSKCGENIYYRCRMVAAKYNEKLKSREGAAELLGSSYSSLSNYENDVLKAIPVDVVVNMADLYNAPALLNHYCLNDCPIGRRHCISDCEASIQAVTIQLMKIIDVDSFDGVKKALLEIAEDGEVSEDEVPLLKSVMPLLEKFSLAVSELKMIVDRLTGGEA